MNEYTIHGGDAGKRRLEILSATIASGTAGFLERAKIAAGSHCLDLGCGGGDVSLALAGLVGEPGHVTGIDLDERKIQLASESAQLRGVKNVSFKTGNAYDLREESTCQLVYSRFLLSHLRQPETVLQRIWHVLQPNGQVLIEDTDFSGHFCQPPSTAFQTYVALYQRLLAKRGANANIGPRLPLLLRECGFVDVEFQISQPAHLEGSGKLMAEITFEGISKALLEEGLITNDEAEGVYAELVHFRQRPDSILSLPRIFQVRGRRPGVPANP